MFNLLEAFDNICVFDQNMVSYLELLKVPYTGCNPRGLTLARDKALARKVLAYHQIPAPAFKVIPYGQKPVRRRTLRFPLIVKSLTYEGSAGIVEQFVNGWELYVGVLGNQRIQVLPIWEMSFANMPADNWRIATERVKWNVDYQKKHGISTGEAKLESEVALRIKNLAARAFRALELSGYVRFDFRLDKDGNPWVIEANPNPQLAREEDFAQSAIHSNMSYSRLLERIMALGLEWLPHRMGIN